MVESEIKYNKAKYNGGEAGTLKRLLRDMRELVHEVTTTSFCIELMRVYSKLIS